jgi:hypothetical protein
MTWDMKGPIKIGDTLRVVQKVTHKRVTKKPMQGIVFFHVALLNQRDEIVQEGECKSDDGAAGTLKLNGREGPSCTDWRVLSCQSRTTLRSCAPASSLRRGRAAPPRTSASPNGPPHPHCP